MTESEKQRAAEVIRRRCCLYDSDDVAWTKRGGMTLKLLGGDAVAWLLEIGVLLDTGETEYYAIDRDKCIDLFYAVTPPEDVIPRLRFSSDMTIEEYRCSQRIKQLEAREDDWRLRLLFREIANAARLMVLQSRWRDTGSCSGYWIEFEREVL